MMQRFLLYREFECFLYMRGEGHLFVLFLLFFLAWGIF
jgi:hypothetical protein